MGRCHWPLSPPLPTAPGAARDLLPLALRSWDGFGCGGSVVGKDHGVASECGGEGALLWGPNISVRSSHPSEECQQNSDDDSMDESW